ncbi:hemerythrin domain-containing protein [Limibacter armeniacum]|uniref:hemerythrin domain-containing protein n=1 Tax=Limibacter armeniacum TaxID=466084 RepID=UPI002FE61121
MKRHEALIPLSRQHHQLLLAGQLLKKDAPPYKGLPTEPKGKAAYLQQVFEGLWKLHTQAEEVVLVPFLKGVDQEVDRLLEELVDEHQQIQELYDSIDFENPAVNTMHALGELMVLHIRKEERQLFQRVQEVFGEKLRELDLGID